MMLLLLRLFLKALMAVISLAIELKRDYYYTIHYSLERDLSHKIPKYDW